LHLICATITYIIYLQTLAKRIENIFSPESTEGTTEGAEYWWNHSGNGNH